MVTVDSSREIVPRISIVGSANKDLIVKVNRIPEIGETAIGEGLEIKPGGKGANQAVAAAMLGAKASFIGRVGEDAFGERLLRAMEERGVDTAHLRKDEGTHTGVALIIVDAEGRNIIAVAPGANARCHEKDVNRAAEVLRSSHVLLLQLEIPLEVVEYAVKMAREGDVDVILNPAPARELPKALLENVQVLVPNEKEVELLSGMLVRDIESAKKAAARVVLMGVEKVIVTLGAEGAVLATENKAVHVPGVPVRAVDTTGAGDAFCGALAVALSSGKDLVEAITYANSAGALATTRVGAQEALPTTEELREFMKERGLT